jgi:hypothetical protein
MIPVHVAHRVVVATASTHATDVVAIGGSPGAHRLPLAPSHLIFPDVERGHIQSAVANVRHLCGGDVADGGTGLRRAQAGEQGEGGECRPQQAAGGMGWWWWWCFYRVGWDKIR